MRVVMTIHPNQAYRSFTCDEIISNERFGGICGDAPKEGKILELYNELTNINLVNEITINRYEVSVSIVEAFEDSAEDWKRIKDSVISAIRSYFNDVDVDFRTKDDRAKYARSGSDDY